MAIKKIKFHAPTTEKIEKLMANDPNYAFRHKVGKVKGKSFFAKVMTSHALQSFLFLLLILLIGMLLGTFLTQTQPLPSRLKTKEIRNEIGNSQFEDKISNEFFLFKSVSLSLKTILTSLVHV